MGAFLLLLLLFIPPLISMAKEDKTAISGYEWDDSDDWDDPINDPAYSDCICNNYYTGD